MKLNKSEIENEVKSALEVINIPEITQLKWFTGYGDGYSYIFEYEVTLEFQGEKINSEKERYYIDFLPSEPIVFICDTSDVYNYKDLIDVTKRINPKVYFVLETLEKSVKKLDTLFRKTENEELLCRIIEKNVKTILKPRKYEEE